MFYDFNGSSMFSAASTAQNFYKGNSNDGGNGVISGGVKDETNLNKDDLQNYRGDGDRVPTRERGYRSANQNFRRRDMQRKNNQMGIGDVMPPGENNDILPPSGL